MENQEDKLVVRSEDEIRASVVTEYGFDEEVDADRIAKLVAREVEHDKKLSSAIGAKIKLRTETDELRKKVPPADDQRSNAAADTKDGDLSPKDLYALMQAQVPEDDVDDVLEYAKLKKITVGEALKSSIVKTILNEKAEFRKTAEATSANNNKRVVTKTDDNLLISKLSKGEVPEKGSEEAERVFWARRGGKR